MPNHYFKFKQFTVHQEKCGMKVTTDACLFGAIIAKTISNSTSPISSCLDIGTGTGLLSLMLKQKNNHLKIDAVEIDEHAAEQAKENFQQSEWDNDLTVSHNSVQQFVQLQTQKYNFIFSNPPFFENDLKSDNHKKNLALHSTELSFEKLIHCIKQLLTSSGRFAILVPYHRTESFVQLAKDFFLEEKISVKQTPSHNYFRSILIFKTQKVETKETEIIIQTKPNQYSEEFIELLKDYYLYL